MTTNRTAQTKEELERHLERQLRFLRSSADAFDDGYEDEAQRLSVSIRILCHDGRGNSRSLLGQLDLKSRLFLDTSMELPGALAGAQQFGGYHGLCFITVGNNARYQAPLSDASGRLVSFEDWWNKTIIRDETGRSLTRNTLVRTVSDQDGGAHVDSTLDSEYFELTKNNSLQWFRVGDEQDAPIDGVGPASIRQIAHELLKTFDSTYEKQPAIEGSVMVGGLFFAPSEPEFKPSWKDLCPCGSHRKYRECCGFTSWRR